MQLNTLPVIVIHFYTKQTNNNNIEILLTKIVVKLPIGLLPWQLNTEPPRFLFKESTYNNYLTPCKHRLIIHLNVHTETVNSNVYIIIARE